MDWSHPEAVPWITSPTLGGPRTVPPAVYYRRAFQLPNAPRGPVYLHVTALGLVECEINGQRVGDEVFAPGWTEYRRRVYYRTYDVSSCLRAGDNVIGAVLGSGWYAGHVANMDRQFYGEHPALRAALTDANGQTLVETDPQWRYAPGPILENDLLMGEAYDARRELGAWSSPGYAAEIWRPVDLAPDPGIAIERSPAPPVRRQETLPGVLLAGATAASWQSPCRRFDFGQNFAGRVRITVEGQRGRTLVIRHAEVLKPDGALYLDNLRSARATDYYTLKGGGPETWEPRFTFHGFRYAEITWAGAASDVRIESADGIVLHSDLAPTGNFACSNPLLNQLAHNIRWGLKGNFLDIPTDCPQRDERLGWTGDAQVFARTAAFFCDVQGFFHKWLQDLRDAQGENGAVPCFAPCPGAFGLSGDGGPAWADATFICAWNLYLCYGDLQILRDHYPSMVRYFDYLSAHKVKDFIRSHPDVDTWGGFGDWLALDGSGQTRGGTPRDLIGTAFYAHAADILARSAALLGKPEEAERYRALRGHIAEAFARRFLEPGGRVAGGTQTSYVLALHFGLVPEHDRSQAAAELVRLIEANGNRIGTGFVGTPYILGVLEDTGHLATAYRLLEQEAFPSWLFPVKNGATTMWEHWDGWTPDKGFRDPTMNSFNHYAYGAVGAWMVTAVAGLELDPAEPGYRHIRFKPRPGGSITHAQASLQTRFGVASIQWALKDEVLCIAMTVPEGAWATLDLPEATGRAPETLKSGNHAISCPCN